MNTLSKSNIISEGWEKVPLSTVVTGAKGKLPKKFDSCKREGFLPYIDIKAFETGQISRYAQIDRAVKITDKDVLVVWDGARFGLCGPGQEGVLGSTLMKLNSSALTADYLRLFLKLHFQTINTRPRGTGTPHVEPELFWNLQIPIAPIAEQKRIVDKIECLFGYLDQAEMLLKQIAQQIIIYRQAVLKAAVTGELTAARVSSWKSYNLQELLEEVRYGTSKKCYANGSGVPILRIPNITPLGVDFSDLKFASLSSDELKKLTLVDGDVLVIRSNGSVSLVGRSTVYKGYDGLCHAFAGYLIRLRVDRSKLMPEFLNMYLHSPTIRSIVERSARSTSGVHNINSDEIRALPINIPSIEEQRKIVEIVESHYSVIESIETQCSYMRVNVKLLRQSMLKSAFSGQLVDQDPNDEPASALLSRIQDKINPAIQSKHPRNHKSKKRAALV